MNYPANTTVIVLSRPCIISGKGVTQFEMREPTVRDKILFEKQQGTPLEREMSTVASLCGVESVDLLTLPSYDYGQLVERMNDFLLLPPAAREAKWKEQAEATSKSTS